MDALHVITIFTSLLLIGVLISIISSKLKLSNVFSLVITGLVLGHFNERVGFVAFSQVALVTVAIMSLVIIVFDGSSRFKKKTVDATAFPALNLVFWFIIFNAVLLILPINFLFFGFNYRGIFFSLMFAALMAATDPATIFAMFKDKESKTLEFLEVEAVFNTPITILIPLLLLDLVSQMGIDRSELFGAYFGEFLTQVVVGVGAGVLVGIIFFKVMRKAYSDSISHLALLTSALLAFVLSEQIGGSGILSVAVLGFVFGNSTISKKEVLQDFSSIISNVLVIMVFLLLGFIISLELSFWFIIKSLIAFLLVAIARYFAVQATLIHSDFTKKEKLYMVLSVPKGIGTAVLLFTLSTIPIPELTVLINLSVMIILYSVILATIVNKFSKNFIGIKIAKK